MWLRLARSLLGFGELGLDLGDVFRVELHAHLAERLAPLRCGHLGLRDLDADQAHAVSVAPMAEAMRFLIVAALAACSGAQQGKLPDVRGTARDQLLQAVGKREA